MIVSKPNIGRHRFSVALLLLFCLIPLLPNRLCAQTPPSSAAVMVEIHCQRGTADQWREEFTKEVLPAIREAVQKGDVYTGFTFLEAPLPYQDVDFILIYEAKSFASLDTRRFAPHYEIMFRRLGAERFAALSKEMGEWEEKVTVRILRSYKLQ